MRNRLTSTIAAGALVVGLGMTATPAKANLIIWYSVDGSALATVADGDPDPNGVLGIINVGGLTVALTGSSNSPGTASLSNVTSASGNFKNSDAVSHSVHLVVTSDGFTLPSSSVDIKTDLSGTTTTIPAGSVSMFSCIDETNSSQSCLASGAFLTTSIGAALTVSPWETTNDTDHSILLTPYALGEDVIININAKSGLNPTTLTFSAQTSLTPVPEPASLAIFGSALLGFGLLRRRRNS